MPKNKKGKLKLEWLQFTAIRLALGLRKSTPTNIFLSESKLTSLEERSRYLCKNFLTKGLSNLKSATNRHLKNYYLTSVIMGRAPNRKHFFSILHWASNIKFGLITKIWFAT